MAEDKTPELDFFTGKPLDGNTPLSQEQAKPETDFFTGTAFNSVPQSSATRQQLQEGLFINEISRPIKGNIEDYTKYGVPLYRGFDWDELRARNQGTAEKWVNGIAKAGVVTATSFTENLLGVPMGIISMAGGGDFFDNSLGRRIDKINDWMQENMPNYRTRQEENNSVLAGLGTANFWADTFLNGLGYSIGSIASVYATGGVGVIGLSSKAVSAAARGMGVYKAAKAIATGTKLANTLQKGARVGTNVLNAAKVADMGFMMALAESSVEARETKKNMIEMLQQDYMDQEGLVNISQIPADVLSDIEDAASAAGNTNFIANLAITGGTNMFMFGKMALGFNGATKKLNNVVYDRALGKFVNTMPNQSVRRAAFEKAAELSKNSLGELLQEGGQYASNIYATEVHGERFHDGGNVDRMQALNKAFTDTFGDKEGRESMLVGALVGLFMGGRGAFGPTQTQKDNGKREALVKILNSGAFDGISKQMEEENVQSATIKKMELAAQQGDIETFKDLQARLIQKHAFNLIERGGYDVYIEMLEDSKNLSDADFMDRFGFPKENENGVPYTIEEHLQGKTKSQFIDGVKEKVEHVNKIYKNVNDMFPLPNQTQGLPRVLMGEEARAAEERAFNRAYNLRRELAGYGYGLYDRARRRSQIVENIQKEIDSNPILKALNINVDSELAKIKELESADIKDMSNSFQTLADKEIEKAKVFDGVMSKISSAAQSPKVEAMISDYLSLGMKDVSAIDAYNRLASDPNYRKAFHEELERNQAAQKDSALDKKVEEVILGAKTSEELETQRPAADTMTDSQIEALRERKAELIKEEDAAKRKYLKRVENKTEEDALEDLKGIDRENLSPTDIVGLRSAIAVMQGKVNLINNPGKKGADAARNIFKGPQPQGDPNLTPEALGGVEKVSEDGRHFVINGKKYYNDKPNIEDVLKTPGKVTLKSDNGNPATFTNKLTVQGITLAIKAAVARRESTSQPDSFNTPTGDKLIQQIDMFGDAVKYWTDQVIEAVKNKEIAPLAQRDYAIVRKEILDLAATLEAGNRLNDALSASKEGNSFSKSVIEKALSRLNTLIATRINTLEKVLQPAEATVEDITNLIEELTQQLETFKATDNNTSNATASKALTKYLTELIRFKIETLKNKLDDSSETDEDTEPPGPTPPTTPGPDAGQTGTGKATDPGTTSESQEFPVVTEETQNLPDEPTSNVFDEPGQGVPGTGHVRDDVSSGLVPNDVHTTKTSYTFEGDQFNVTINSIDKDGNRNSDPDSIVGYEVNVSSLNNEGVKLNSPGLYKTFKTLEEAVKYGNLYVKSDPATNNTSEKESIDPVEPGQVDNSTRPPLFDEHGNIQITEESQELPNEPTEDVFGTPEQSSEVAATPAESDPDLLNISPDIRDARNGDVAAQKRLEEYGIDWKKSTTYRFVGQSEVDILLNNQRVKSRRGEADNGIDVTFSETVTTAADATHRVTFKESFDKNNGLGKVRAKNETDGNLEKGRGYDINDVQKIEVLDDNGNVVETLYDAKSTTQPTQASDVKQSDIDNLLSKKKTIKIGRYTPSAKFSDRVSGENLFLEVIDALNSIVSFNRTISSEQIKQIDEVLDLFAPVLSIKTIDRIIAKYEDEDANFLEVLNGLNKLKQKKLAETNAMQGYYEFAAAKDAAQQNSIADIERRRAEELENAVIKTKLKQGELEPKENKLYRTLGESGLADSLKTFKLRPSESNSFKEVWYSEGVKGFEKVLRWATKYQNEVVIIAEVDSDIVKTKNRSYAQYDVSTPEQVSLKEVTIYELREDEAFKYTTDKNKVDKINAKYDAELAALGQKPAKPAEQQGVQVMYTPKGKPRQTYTIVGTKILNANGKEVYKKDSADRRKIFANLRILQKRARVVEYKGNKYVVNDRNQIMSVATGKIMEWGENDGNRKAILALLKPITSTVSTNQAAATPPEATYTPKPGGMQLMNDASFKTRDSSGRYYVAVNPDGTPDLMAALMPDGFTSYGPVTVVEQDETELTEKVLIPNTGLLVSSSPGESVSFVLARELWFNDTLSNYEDFSKESTLNQRFEDIPIHVYKDGSFVGRLESANPTNRLERKEIVRRLAKGETVTAPITKIVGTNPNYARSTEDEQGYFSDPRQIIAGDVNIAAVSLDRGVMSLESGVESINEDFLEIASSINFSNLLPGSIVFKVNPSQTPNNQVNFVKGFTRNLDGAAINAVNKMLSEGNMEGVKEVVANSPASDSQSDTYLNIDKFGQTGQNFMVFKSPSLGRMVRVSSEEMLKAMRSNGVAKVGLVAFSDETDQFQTDKSAKVPRGYNVRKDFQDFIQGKKFQVDVEKANNNAPFYNPAELENGSPKYYESYQEYLFGDRYEGMNGHNSILSLDVVEVNGSIYHDLGVAFDRLSASGEAADKVVAAVNNIKPAQVSGKIQAIRANRNLNNRRRNNNIQDMDDFDCL
jgi:hypothetical protein